MCRGVADFDELRLPTTAFYEFFLGLRQPYCDPVRVDNYLDSKSIDLVRLLVTGFSTPTRSCEAACGEW